MKILLLSPVLFTLWGCGDNKPTEVSSEEPLIDQLKNSALKTLSIELSDERGFETVQISIKGKDNLKINVFEKNGRLVASVLDNRETPFQGMRTVQRWELLAESNSNVAVDVRKDLYYLKTKEEIFESPDNGKGDLLTRSTVKYSDTNGDGIVDFTMNANGVFKVKEITYEEIVDPKSRYDSYMWSAIDPAERYIALENTNPNN